MKLLLRMFFGVLLALAGLLVAGTIPAAGDAAAAAAEEKAATAAPRPFAGADARLQALLDELDAARGDARHEAMAAVVRELASRQMTGCGGPQGRCAGACPQAERPADAPGAACPHAATMTAASGCGCRRGAAGGAS